MADSSSIPAWVTDGIDAVREASEHSDEVTPSRYPHTYAYDHLRSNAAAFGVPLDATGSRSETAGWLRDRIGANSTNPAHLAVVRALADAYIADNHLEWPAGVDGDAAIDARSTVQPDGSVHWA